MSIKDERMENSSPSATFNQTKWNKDERRNACILKGLGKLFINLHGLQQILTYSNDTWDTGNIMEQETGTSTCKYL